MHYLYLSIKFIHLSKLVSFATFLPINSIATPWSGDTLRYLRPKVRLIASNLNKVLNGDKICGKFGSSDYGRLSILTNYKFNIIKKFLVTKNCFLPKPKVTSILIHFKPKRDLFKIKKLENLEKITNIMFSNKRKMVNKNIKKILNQNQIKSLNNFKGNLRPAEIKPETYYEITELYEKR